MDPNKRNIWDRLTDHTKYTGLHKHRFDESGRGRGLAGRDRVVEAEGAAPGLGLAAMTRTNLNKSGTTHVPRPRSGTSPGKTTSVSKTSSVRTSGYRPTNIDRSPVAPPAAATTTNTDSDSIASTSPPAAPSRRAPSARARSLSPRKATKPDNDSVLQRLTDPSKYTGTHVHRFDEQGRGRGIEGRDRPIKGAGHRPNEGLANMTRNYLNKSPTSSVSAGTTASTTTMGANHNPAVPGESGSGNTTTPANRGSYAARPPRRATQTTRTDNDAILQRLTDPSKYTGVHKHRFDEAGRGRGLEGR